MGYLFSIFCKGTVWWVTSIGCSYFEFIIIDYFYGLLWWITYFLYFQWVTSMGNSFTIFFFQNIDEWLATNLKFILHIDRQFVLKPLAWMYYQWQKSSQILVFYQNLTTRFIQFSVFDSVFNQKHKTLDFFI